MSTAKEQSARRIKVSVISNRLDAISRRCGQTIAADLALADLFRRRAIS